MSDQSPPTPPTPPTPPQPGGSSDFPSYPSYSSYPGDGAGAGGSTPPPYGGGGGGYGGYGDGFGDPAGPPQYSVGAAWRIGFRLFGKYAGPFVLVMVVLIVSVGIFAGLEYLTSDHTTTTSTSGFTFQVNSSPSGVVLNILANIVSVLISAALVKGALDAVDGREVTFATMFEGWNKVAVLIAALITGVLTALGMLLLIIPGLIVAFLLWYTNFFIIDQNVAAWDAIKRSARFSIDNFGSVFLTAVVALGTIVAGACACGVGLFVAVPVVEIMAACAFRQLQGRAVYDGR